MCCRGDGGGVVSLTCGSGLIFIDAESDCWSFTGHAQTQNGINMATVTTAAVMMLPPQLKHCWCMVGSLTASVGNLQNSQRFSL